MKSAHTIATELAAPRGGPVWLSVDEGLALLDQIAARDPRLELCSQLAVLADDGAPPTEFCLLSAGDTRTTKGTIKCDAEHAAVCLLAETVPKDGRLPLDYDHGMLNPFGGEKKAAGWFKLTERNGSLWATDVQYTPAAEKALREKEYRYFSPALYRDEAGFVTRMVNCALTCLPATLNQTPLVASETPAAPEGNDMTLEQLCAAFGVQNATQLAAKFNQLQGDINAKTAENSALLAASQALTTELNTVKAALNARAEADGKAEKTAFIEQLSTGASPKLSPAMRPWAETQTLAQLQAYAAIAPVIAAVNPGATVTTPPSNPAAQLATLTAAEVALCAQMKINPADFIAQRALLASQNASEGPLNLNVASAAPAKTETK